MNLQALCWCCLHFCMFQSAEVCREGLQESCWEEWAGRLVRLLGPRVNLADGTAGCKPCMFHSHHTHTTLSGSHMHPPCVSQDSAIKGDGLFPSIGCRKDLYPNTTLSILPVLHRHGRVCSAVLYCCLHNPKGVHYDLDTSRQSPWSKSFQLCAHEKTSIARSLYPAIYGLARCKCWAPILCKANWTRSADLRQLFRARYYVIWTW